MLTLARIGTILLRGSDSPGIHSAQARAVFAAAYAIFYDMPSLHILNDANNVAPFSYSVELFLSGLLLDDPYGGVLDDGSPARPLNRFPVSDFASDTPFALPLYTIVAQNQYITPDSQN